MYRHETNNHYRTIFNSVLPERDRIPENKRGTVLIKCPHRLNHRKRHIELMDVDLDTGQYLCKACLDAQYRRRQT